MSGELLFGLGNEGIGLGRGLHHSLSECRAGQRQRDQKRNARNQDPHGASLAAPNPRGQVGEIHLFGLLFLLASVGPELAVFKCVTPAPPDNT